MQHDEKPSRNMVEYTKGKKNGQDDGFKQKTVEMGFTKYVFEIEFYDNVKLQEREQVEELSQLYKMEWYHQWESEYRAHKEEHELGTGELDECLNDAIIIYNDVTIKGVLSLLSMNNLEREDTIHKGKCRDIMDRITELIRYRIQPKMKEKGLQTIILVIVRDCIERNLENKVFDRLIGNPELVEHKYILEDWDVERRFEKFWQWYRVVAKEIKPITIGRRNSDS
ncbi:hypothetical protein RhiirA4_481479 [Rhizophagus irregularis]|uniref:Uncharacterized protein n=1 Tax=Rhizophagus irregularis TaxID=588596 RepID=A0A2I1HJI5_9GLOM|nr:hypothetical protein RhiirA4_481479 [Rhizophagus irregularis]